MLYKLYCARYKEHLEHTKSKICSHKRSFNVPNNINLFPNTIFMELDGLTRNFISLIMLNSICMAQVDCRLPISNKVIQAYNAIIDIFAIQMRLVLVASLSILLYLIISSMWELALYDVSIRKLSSSPRAIWQLKQDNTTSVMEFLFPFLGSLW